MDVQTAKHVVKKVIVPSLALGMVIFLLYAAVVGGVAMTARDGAMTQSSFLPIAGMFGASAAILALITGGLLYRLTGEIPDMWEFIDHIFP